jgi:anion-transporting  ArsA/GET3 family ATPase
VILDDLLSRRLLVLSGKGGVGKSVVGMALAVAAHRRGKRVLFVEVDADLPAARVLGNEAGLSSVNLNPPDVMDEYVQKTVRVDLLARKVLQSPVYRRFFAAAPGLADLMVLGKVMVLVEAHARWSQRPVHDLVILDAPATGHGLAFLKVPLAASEAVPVGPVGNNARRILRLLRDPERTALGIVAIPEEMAAVEAAEMNRLAADDVGITPRVLFLNQCHERRFTDEQEAEVLRLSAARADGPLASGVTLAGALAAARRHLRRRKLTRFYETRLRRAVKAPLVTLPYLHEEIGPQSIRLLASRLEAA